jgi:hypothetical protein
LGSSKVRVSIANLAWYARPEGSVFRHFFGIINQKKLAEEGKRQYMALGGGAMLTEIGKNLLEAQVGATNFEFDEKTGFFDARFQVEEDRFESAFFHFEGYYATLEHDPTLGIMAELTVEESGHESIFTADEAKMVRVLPLGVVRQQPAKAGTDTSARASAEMPTRRLFRIYELVMPSILFAKLHKSSVVRFLSDAERTTTDGGSKAGRTSDGYLIQNNLFL